MLSQARGENWPPIEGPLPDWNRVRWARSPPARRRARRPQPESADDAAARGAHGALAGDLRQVMTAYPGGPWN